VFVTYLPSLRLRSGNAGARSLSVVEGKGWNIIVLHVQRIDTGKQWVRIYKHIDKNIPNQYMICRSGGC